MTENKDDKLKSYHSENRDLRVRNQRLIEEVERLKEMVGAAEKIVGIVKEIRSLDPEPMRRFGSVARANELIAEIDPALKVYEACKDNKKDE